MKNVVYYARVSTDEEKQLNALEKQIEELKAYIEKQTEWILIDEYVDEGKSGTTAAGRKQYTRLYNEIDTGKFDIIVIKDQSRLMRNTLDWYKFMDKINKSDVKLFIYLDNSFYTPNDAFIAGIKAMMAEEYSRDLSKKISNSAKRSQEQGTVYGNGTMLGYDQANGKLVINEEEAKIVRFVFDSYVSGKGFRSIFKELDKMGIKSRNGTHFSQSTLKRMIRNEKYKGVLVARKTKKSFETKKTTFRDKSEWIIKEDVVPAIVTKEIWEQANNILQARKDKLKNKDDITYTGYFQGSYPLSGLLYCGKCGSQMWHSSYNYKAGRVDVWQCKNYRLFGKTSEFGCSCKTFKNEELESIIKEAIYGIVSQNKDMISVTIKTLRKVFIDDKQEVDPSKLKMQLDSVNAKKKRLLDFLLDKTISKQEYNQKKEALDIKSNELQKQIDETISDQQRLEAIEKRLKDIKETLSKSVSSPQDISGEYLRGIVKRVELYDDTIDIYLNDGSKTTCTRDHYYPLMISDACYCFGLYFAKHKARLRLHRNYSVRVLVSTSD